MDKDQTKKKFDVAYMMAKEKMAFTKMKPLCELEKRHGVKTWHRIQKCPCMCYIYRVYCPRTARNSTDGPGKSEFF